MSFLSLIYFFFFHLFCRSFFSTKCDVGLDKIADDFLDILENTAWKSWHIISSKSYAFLSPSLSVVKKFASTIPDFVYPAHCTSTRWYLNSPCACTWQGHYFLDIQYDVILN